MQGFLITEQIMEGIESLVEENKTGGKDLYIRGPFMQYETVNRNNRRYPRDTVLREVARYNKEKIQNNSAFGELGHPPGPTVNLERSCIMIKELWDDGKLIMGKAKVLDTPMGKIVKQLIGEGATLGVSSRGVGSLKRGSNCDDVQEDFYLATPADVVADPSAPAAFVQGVMEGVQWVYDPMQGSWRQSVMQEIVQTVNEAARTAVISKREDLFLEAFKKYVSNL